MEYLNKTFKNRITGDIFQIIDVYQNIAITSSKEKINTNLLSDDKFFTPVNTPPKSINESMRNIKDDSVDPNKFFSNKSTYNAFAEQIKKVPLENVPFDDPSNALIIPKGQSEMTPTTLESAVIMSDPEDEIEELKRKYGATSVQSGIQKQNELFSKFLKDEEASDFTVQKVEVPRVDVQIETTLQNQKEAITMNQTTIHPREMNDPVTLMFKNIKRNQDFSVELKIEGKIPRTDFIEMMEDSYEVSIIDYLADEFTRNLLNDPSQVRDKIKDKIKSLIQVKSKSIETPEEVKNDLSVKKTPSRRKKTDTK